MSEEKTPWHVELSPELQGVLQTRGWDKLEPAKAAGEILKVYRDLELMKGAPPERLVKLPAKTELEAPDEWREVWTRLGAPAEPAGYEFAEGTPEELAEVFRSQAASLGLPAGKVKDLAGAVSKHLEERELAAAALADNSSEERGKLKANWGKNYDANLFVAQEAAKRHGISAEAVSALEKTIGYSGVMEHLLQLGMRGVEAKFVTGGPQNGVMSVEMAIAKRAELKADKAWVAKLLSGGANEKKELAALQRIIVGMDVA